jgi:hypothetical protein
MLTKIAPNVQDSGVCITDPEGLAEAIKALNLACGALHKRIDADFSTLWTWSMPVYDQCFALPEDCLEGRQMFINGATATQHDEWYQGKLACGMADSGSIRYGPEIIDLGQFAIPFRLTQIRDTRVAFVAQSDADVGAQIQIELTNNYGETKRETLILLANQMPVTSESVVRDVTWLQKPVTQDNVKLYQVYPDGQRAFICDYSPSTTLGAFRRKKVPQPLCGCSFLTIKGKRRYQEILSANDICPFDDPIALSWAVSAIAALRRKEMDTYAGNLQMALNELYKGMRDGDSPSNVAQARFRSGFGPNPSQAGNNPMPGTSMWGSRGRAWG